MVVIRLRRAGSKKRPFFRVVVTDSRAARDSSFVEILGHYNPRTKPALVDVNKERVDYWLKKGAQPSDTVRTLIARHLTPKPAAEPAPRAGEMSAATSGTGVKAVVEVLARALTDRPDDVRVVETEHKGTTLVELYVAPGRSGQGHRQAGPHGGGAADARGIGGRARRARPSRWRSGTGTVRSADGRSGNVRSGMRWRRSGGSPGRTAFAARSS